MKKWSFAAGCLLALGSAAWAADVRIVIDTAAKGPVINKNVYGQFAEHLGSGIYGGMWVGPNSPIPNVRGWRKDVVGALKELHVPLVRWPGGCFADEYHWRDGVGPRNKRPVRVNTNWGGVDENNAVGTHEFFDLAEQLGADTYVNGNLGTGSAQEMSEWLEYMTGTSKSSLAELRRANGRKEPFRLQFFAVGNEAWGCGGNMEPATYVAQYKQATTFLKAPPEAKVQFIASGGNDHDTKWTDALSSAVKQKMAGISYHYYTIPTGKWEVKGAATGFDEGQWIATLASTLKIDQQIENNLKVLAKNDPEGKVGFYVDEWGTWYDVEPGTNEGFLYQQNTLRDAIVAALNFNVFHKHAQRVQMTNIAQMVNVLQAMILTDGSKMLRTPTYHAYRLYVPFQGATVVPLTVSGDTQYKYQQTSIPSLSASAARAKDGKLYLALVNTDPRNAATVDVSGGSFRAASGQVLTAAAMDAHNTFAAPDAVRPANYKAAANAGRLSLQLPAKAVMVVALEE